MIYPVAENDDDVVVWQVQFKELLRWLKYWLNISTILISAGLEAAVEELIKSTNNAAPLYIKKYNICTGIAWSLGNYILVYVGGRRKDLVII